jgi:hypothetical protein
VAATQSVRFAPGGIREGPLGNLLDVVRTPYSYYYFLAGLTRLTGARRVLEVGTHQGGSTRSIVEGFADRARSRIVTFDITPDGAKAFANDPVVKAYTIDANSEAAVDVCTSEFGGSTMDLVFIDGPHEFWKTLQAFATYSSVFACPLFVLDDITLNPPMERLWKLIVDRYGSENAIDAVNVNPAIRTSDNGVRPGFGIVRIPKGAKPS